MTSRFKVLLLCSTQRWTLTSKDKYWLQTQVKVRFWSPKTGLELLPADQGFVAPRILAVSPKTSQAQAHRFLAWDKQKPQPQSQAQALAHASKPSRRLQARRTLNFRLQVRFSPDYVHLWLTPSSSQLTHILQRSPTKLYQHESVLKSEKINKFKSNKI